VGDFDGFEETSLGARSVCLRAPQCDLAIDAVQIGEPEPLAGSLNEREVSGSMTKDELRIEREGYVNALRDVDVINATLSGTRGRIAVAYFEWASPDDQRLIMPWTVIDGPDSARSFADALEEQPLETNFDVGLKRGGTSISGALFFSSRLLQSSGLRADRHVIDVSGDGPNNSGPPIAPVRYEVIARGATINGLAISLSKRGAIDTANPFEEQTLGWYYEGCVIGGPGASSSRSAIVRISKGRYGGSLCLKSPVPRCRSKLAGESVLFRPNCFAIGQFPGR
jgi:hypothetical protein